MIKVQVSPEFLLPFITGIPQRDYRSPVPGYPLFDRFPLDHEYIFEHVPHPIPLYLRNNLLPKTYVHENSDVIGCIVQTIISRFSPSNSLQYWQPNISEESASTCEYGRRMPSPQESLCPCTHKVGVKFYLLPLVIFRRSPSFGTSVSTPHGTCIPRPYVLTYTQPFLNSFPLFIDQEKLEPYQYRKGVLYFLYLGKAISILTGIAGGLANRKLCWFNFLHSSRPLRFNLFPFRNHCPPEVVSFISASAAFAAKMNAVAVPTTYSFSNHKNGQSSFNSGKSGLTITIPGIIPPGMNE
jgi:hypothetical protein